MVVVATVSVVTEVEDVLEDFFFLFLPDSGVEGSDEEEEDWVEAQIQ